MKRIVVGIDGSPQSWAALDQAAEQARLTHAALQIVHVTPPLVSPMATADYAPTMSGWAESQEAYARGLLREAVARVKADGLEIEPLSRLGGPAEVLADLAEAKEVTMVVVGHRGRNLAARLFIGSVADRLVQISPKPVLVVR